MDTFRARRQCADPRRRWIGQDHRVADADHLGRADPHPGQVQFYVLAYSSTALTTVAGLPHVGEVVGPTHPYGVRRTVAELLALLRDRKRTFLEYDVPSMEVFRRRKFGGEAGRVPNDGFGDVFLVIDNYRALAEENEVLIEQVNVIINQGPSFGIHVVAWPTANLSCVRRCAAVLDPHRAAAGWVEDAKLVRSRFAKEVPVKPGRGMVAVNYTRLDGDPQSGLHTLVAEPGACRYAGQRFRVQQRRRGGQPGGGRPRTAGAQASPRRSGWSR